MTQTQTPVGPRDPLLFTSLNGLTIPKHAVVIIDQDLPKEIFEHFPEAISVQAGESLKTFAAIEEIAAKVLDRRSTKPLIIIAVGGGSVGDAIGFLASVLWRGVELWHVPTTLLAMVDSAHGGKTALNLGQNKNQIGTFYPAHKVIIATEIIESLPFDQRREGLVELLKALWLDDATGLEQWQAVGASALSCAPYSDIADPLESLLARAIAVKHRIVAEDPFEEREIRTLLNLGHTAGHGLELTAGLSHGDAIGWGLLACLILSRENDLSEASFQRLYRSLYPLLCPLSLSDLPSREAFHRVVARDKKKRGGELRSVLLHELAEPYVTTCTPDAWYDALVAAHEHWETTKIRIQMGVPKPCVPQIQASKSAVNRALTIQYLNSQVTISGELSQADDVKFLSRSLGTLKQGQADAGEGGTTLRFLLALAAASPNSTFIRASPGLMSRPHDALIEALTAAGAQIEIGDGGFEVIPWSAFPSHLSVSVDTSSQPASALAMLAAGGHAFELTLRNVESFASPGYFDLTLAMLEEAGVQFTRSGSIIQFRGCDELSHEISAAPDASSAAIWAVLNRLGASASLPEPDPLQPDHVVESALDALDDGQPVLGTHAPDLIPVLAAYAASRGLDARFQEVSNLAGKESDRIRDLADLLSAAGGHVTTDSQTIHIMHAQLESVADLDPAGDHRLAFAAAVLSTQVVVQLDSPWVVRKSYPWFWHHLRQAGWHVEPVEA